MLSWLAATILVLLLVVVVGRSAAWLLRRYGRGSGEVALIGQWRVAPDARVRAVRVLDEVHWFYERGRSTAHLGAKTAVVEDTANTAQAPAAPMPAEPRRARAVAGG